MSLNKIAQYCTVGWSDLAFYAIFKNGYISVDFVCTVHCILRAQFPKKVTLATRAHCTRDKYLPSAKKNRHEENLK